MEREEEKKALSVSELEETMPEVSNLRIIMLMTGLGRYITFHNDFQDDVRRSIWTR